MSTGHSHVAPVAAGALEVVGATPLMAICASCTAASGLTVTSGDGMEASGNDSVSST